MGKSASGKDSLYKAILKRQPIPLKTITTYTTRPIRSNEHDGVEYHFTAVNDFRNMQDTGKVIEYRCYHTVFGDWYYFTADDGQIDNEHDYLTIMTLEGYTSLRRYFGNERIIPIYINVEDGLRLERALERERRQEHPAYAEMCRRFLADSEDFSGEKLKEQGITQYFENNDFDACLEEICTFIAQGGT
ncbi:MAG: guanylate kinase [Lachnospiraceae bacterium]|nr:guanylate kinase [Lachnospiraceae bacterium]